MTSTLAYTGDDLDDFGLWARELREFRIERRAKRPWVRLWDGDWHYRGTCVSEKSGHLRLVENDTGEITLELPIDMDDRRGTFLAWWCLEEEKRGTRNVHITIDKDGARIAGRMHPEKGATLKRGVDGDVVVIEFLEDIQELKHVHVAASPFLPISLIQQPKVWMLFARADHGLLATLAVNLWRLQATNINLPDDLLDPDEWTEGLWAQSQIVPVPRKLSQSVAPMTIITGQIKQSWWEIAAPILEDAELMIKTWRWLTGDPEPWPGAGTNWRNGTLFVDIVDKSGWQTGTSLGGNLATGLIRTIANVTSNYVEDSYDLLTGAPVDTSGYKIPGFLSTQPARPYVIYRDGAVTGLQNFELTRSPGGPARITAGGKSMPGVNELEEAIIGYAGDVLGDNLVVGGYGVGSLGNILNAFLMPILRDSILAYMSVPLIIRAHEQGWGHYLETAATGVTQAYTPSAFMDLRKRRRETDPDTAFSFSVADAAPWLIGDRGQGHWWLGDRVGATCRYLGARVFVCRCRELSLPWGEGKASTWEAKFGNLRTQQDALEKAIGLISTTMSALQEIGAF
ncbi:minor tail protein [Gordonia phage Floral]|nr:minor tail protein [Gordonia phage Pollux]QAY17623.1 minor tail protein [Gordonia phage EMsquaredA]QDP45105.1 minor tail protein [Gordonia phage Marteena]QTF81723.1 minor tail protein [Gordonia phage BeeGee]QZD97153.1 minor tail protein [Gordonia phage Floral]QZD97538.1 minor tail protein [Gordonia phage LonelyBoi]